MNRTAVISEMMVAVGYDSASAALEIEFRSGAVYKYLGVSHDDYAALLAAPSKGRHFNAHLRNAFDFRRVR